MGAAMAGVIVAYIAGGMAASMLAGVDRDRLLTGGLVVQASAALALVAAVTVVPASVLGVLLPVMVLTAAVGVVFPACTAVILDRFAERSATASAANSFVTLGIAAAISGLFGLVPLRPSFSVALIILFCCGAALLVHHLGARSLRLRAPAS
jgi:hypothetical protein